MNDSAATDPTQKPPRAMKSRSSSSSSSAAAVTDLRLFGGGTAADYAPLGEALPVSPFKSFNEKSLVFNCGVAAGAGLSLWRPMHKVTKEGSYKVAIASKLRDAAYSQIQQPFFS
jgi:hypothetical protein